MNRDEREVELEKGVRIISGRIEWVQEIRLMNGIPDQDEVRFMDLWILVAI